MPDSPGGQEPSNWELMRGIENIQKALKDVVTQQVFAAWQEGNERRHIQHETKLTEWIGESRAAHSDLGGEVRRVERESVIAVSIAKKEARDALDALADQLAAQEKAQREGRQRTYLALAVAVLGIVGSVLIKVLGG
jgi:hypothetical protein